MKFHPKVTIVIPVYDGEIYLAEAIESALGQTYDALEVIVVNDGSDDGGRTEEIARRYGDEIRYIEKVNGGVASALNVAVQHMTGDVFTWLSHDDIFCPTKIADQVDYYNQIGRSDIVLFSDVHLIDERGEVFHTERWPLRKFLKAPMLPLMNACINGCTIFVPIEILRKAGPFNEELRFTQDYDVWNRMLHEHEFILQPKPLIRYRFHPHQGSHKIGAVKEGDALWIRIMEARSETERVQLFGSTKRFYSEMADYLATTRYEEARRHAEIRVGSAVSKAHASIILTYTDDVDKTVLIRAAKSVLQQVDQPFELIIIGIGTRRAAFFADLLREADGVRCLESEFQTVPAAINQGLALASGTYIAFLRADDIFLPNKLRRQLEAMQVNGSVFSHTSYTVVVQDKPEKTIVVNASSVEVSLFYESLGNSPMELSTVMIHRSVFDAGFEFLAEDSDNCHALSWIFLAQRYELLSLPDVLSVVQWSSDRAPNSLEKHVRNLSAHLSYLRTSEHSADRSDLARLDRELNEAARLLDETRGV